MGGFLRLHKNIKKIKFGWNNVDLGYNVVCVWFFRILEAPEKTPKNGELENFFGGGNGTINFKNLLD